MKNTYIINNLVKSIIHGGNISGAHVKLPYRNFMLVLPPHIVIICILILIGFLYKQFINIITKIQEGTQVQKVQEVQEVQEGNKVQEVQEGNEVQEVELNTEEEDIENIVEEKIEQLEDTQVTY